MRLDFCIILPKFRSKFSFPHKWGTDPAFDRPAIGSPDGWLRSSQKQGRSTQIQIQPHTHIPVSTLCKKETHTPHIFNCTNIKANLTGLYLWTNHVNVGKLFIWLSGGDNLWLKRMSLEESHIRLQQQH